MCFARTCRRKEPLTRTTKTYFLSVLVFRVSWGLMSSQPWLWRSTSTGVCRLTFWYKIYTYTVKKEAVRSPETSVCFSLSTQRHEQGTCNLHFKYCLLRTKNCGRKTVFANFRNLCVYVMKYSDECICRNGSDSCELYDRGWLTLNTLTCKIWWAPNKASRWQMGFNSAFKGLNPTRGEWKIKADGRRDASNYSLVRKEINEWP